MKKLFGILALLFSVMLTAESPSALFDEGNKAYVDGDFELAVQLYDSIRKQGYESTELFYNLANAYYKNKQVAQAILNYERAASLSPYDEDVQNNLKIAQGAVLDKFEVLPEPLFKTLYMDVMKMFSPSLWSVLALVFFILMSLAIYMYLFTSIKRPGFITGIVSLIFGSLCLTMAFVYSNHKETHVPAIIMSASSYVKSAPSESAEDMFILHEGTKTEVLDELEGWKKIRLIDGKIGWIESGDLEEV